MKISFPVTVRELVHAHIGRAAVVMGGGPSLAKDIDRCPIGALYLSANDHGAKLLAERFDRRCDFLVALDDIRDRLVPWRAPIVGRYFWADYRILKFRLRNGLQNSAMAAAWLARLMGCAPIIIAGVDCYDGGAYWHAPKAESNGFTSTPKQHKASWREFVGLYPAMYRVFGGALHGVAVERLYDATESPAAPPPREELVHEVSGVYCSSSIERLVIRRQVFTRDEVVELDRQEAESLAEKKSVRILGPAP